jgi:hypothetical protein
MKSIDAYFSYLIDLAKYTIKIAELSYSSSMRKRQIKGIDDLNLVIHVRLHPSANNSSYRPFLEGLVICDGMKRIVDWSQVSQLVFTKHNNELINT